MAVDHVAKSEHMVNEFVLVGGSGFVGRAVTGALLAAGRNVTIVDRQSPPADLVSRGARLLAADVLIDELPPLPDGEVVILLGSANPRPRWPWTLPVSNAMATGRILRQLEGRSVLLLSSVEIYGMAPAPLREDTPPELPWSIEQIDRWCDEAIQLAREPCPPWRAAPLARRMAVADPTGRWIYAMSKLAQERLLMRAVDPRQLTILRLANVSGTGQEGLICRLVRKGLRGDPLPVSTAACSFVPVEEVAQVVIGGLAPGVYNVGSEPVPLTDVAEEIRALCGSVSPLARRQPAADDSCGIVDSAKLAAAGYQVTAVRVHLERVVEAIRAGARPVLEPALPVVVPPRAFFPDQVAERQQASLWNGQVKHGNRWSEQLGQELARALGVGSEHTVLVMASGTAALRVVTAAAAGPASAGEAALLPSFTFPATAEVLLQLGYQPRFVDVDDRTWTLDPEQVRRELATSGARLVVCVDTFGNPCDYAALGEVCREAEVPLVADSAAALGSRIRGIPVALQADGHAFSMSFAKVLSAAGAGGVAVLPTASATATQRDRANWCRSELMDELHAIYALDQLAMLDDLVRRRNQVAEIYQKGLSPVPGLVAQEIRPGNTHSYVHWVMRIPDPPGRDILQRALAGCGVHTRPYFRALHLTRLGNGELLPVTERLDAQVLALPMSSELTEDEAENVVTAVKHCLAQFTPEDGHRLRR
jgi:dTDP-4-amino-4,6-dideoxygalactose transaminase/nucleoside-diphosphate-sugar epimerase